MGAFALSMLLAGPALAQSADQGKSSPAAQNPCVQPATIVPIEDYTGPFHRLALWFARKPEIKTVSRPAMQTGRICALAPGQKFHLFVRNTFEPVTLLTAALNAGLSQAFDDDPSFGQGAEGYGKRLGAAALDRVSSGFFHTFFFPVVFRQDPRYYRLGEGAGGVRLRHALMHTFVTHGDSGKKMFNFSEWMGSAATTALSNTYHPGNRRGVGPASAQIAIGVGTDMATDVVREFWPEIIRKFKLPFRVPPPQPTPKEK